MNLRRSSSECGNKFMVRVCLTMKAEPPGAGDVARASGTQDSNPGWLQRMVRPHKRHNSKWLCKSKRTPIRKLRSGQFAPPSASQPQTNYQQSTHLHPRTTRTTRHEKTHRTQSSSCGLTMKADLQRVTNRSAQTFETK